VTGYGSLFGRIFGSLAEKLMDGLIGVFLVGVLGGSFIIIHDYLIKARALTWLGVTAVVSL
jgi:hypothetical protein